MGSLSEQFNYGETTKALDIAIYKPVARFFLISSINTATSVFPGAEHWAAMENSRASLCFPSCKKIGIRN
jgi:hypothetical protein